jgi:hypothetical protein
MSTQISLERVVALRVAVSWHEAVAVALQVGRKARVSAPAHVGLDNCLLSTSGTVLIAGPSGNPFTREATWAVLGALLDRARAPRELLVLLARSDRSPVEDISDDLEFFERPDAQTLITALAQRALAAEADERQLAELERLREEASTAAHVVVPDVATRPTRGIAWPIWGIVTVAIIAGGAAAAIAIAQTDTRAGAAALGVPTNASVQQLAGRIESFVGEGLAALGLRESPPEHTPEAASEPAGPASPSVTRRSRGSSKAPVIAVRPGLAEGARTSVEILEQVDLPVKEHTVEDSTEDDVRPPVLRWPQLRQPLGSTPITADTPYLELLINETGTVEKVQLRAADTSFHERMIISAAKAWVFYPATKNGRPVKYQMKVPILE